MVPFLFGRVTARSLANLNLKSKTVVESIADQLVKTLKRRTSLETN